VRSYCRFLRSLSGSKPLWFDHSLQEVYESKRNEHLNELQRKEDEMRQMFVQRVKDKESELKKAEKEVGVVVVEPVDCCFAVFFVALLSFYGGKQVCFVPLPALVMSH